MPGTLQEERDRLIDMAGNADQEINRLAAQTGSTYDVAASMYQQQLRAQRDVVAQLENQHPNANYQTFAQLQDDQQFSLSVSYNLGDMLTEALAPTSSMTPTQRENAAPIYGIIDTYRNTPGYQYIRPELEDIWGRQRHYGQYQATPPLTPEQIQAIKAGPMGSYDYHPPASETQQRMETAWWNLTANPVIGPPLEAITDVGRYTMAQFSALQDLVTVTPIPGLDMTATQFMYGTLAAGPAAAIGFTPTNNPAYWYVTGPQYPERLESIVGPYQQQTQDLNRRIAEAKAAGNYELAEQLNIAFRTTYGTYNDPTPGALQEGVQFVLTQEQQAREFEQKAQALTALSQSPHDLGPGYTIGVERIVGNLPDIFPTAAPMPWNAQSVGALAAYYGDQALQTQQGDIRTWQNENIDWRTQLAWGVALDWSVPFEAAMDAMRWSNRAMRLIDSMDAAPRTVDAAQAAIRAGFQGQPAPALTTLHGTMGWVNPDQLFDQVMAMPLEERPISPSTREAFLTANPGVSNAMDLIDRLGVNPADEGGPILPMARPADPFGGDLSNFWGSTPARRIDLPQGLSDPNAWTGAVDEQQYLASQIRTYAARARQGWYPTAEQTLTTALATTTDPTRRRAYNAIDVLYEDWRYLDYGAEGGERMLRIAPGPDAFKVATDVYMLGPDYGLDVNLWGMRYDKNGVLELPTTWNPGTATAVENLEDLALNPTMQARAYATSVAAQYNVTKNAAWDAYKAAGENPALYRQASARTKDYGIASRLQQAFAEPTSDAYYELLAVAAGEIPNKNWYAGDWDRVVTVANQMGLDVSALTADSGAPLITPNVDFLRQQLDTGVIREIGATRRDILDINRVTRAEQQEMQGVSTLFDLFNRYSTAPGEDFIATVGNADLANLRAGDQFLAAEGRPYWVDWQESTMTREGFDVPIRYGRPENLPSTNLRAGSTLIAADIRRMQRQGVNSLSDVMLRDYGATIADALETGSGALTGNPAELYLGYQGLTETAARYNLHVSASRGRDGINFSLNDASTWSGGAGTMEADLLADLERQGAWTPITNRAPYQAAVLSPDPAPRTTVFPQPPDYYQPWLPEAGLWGVEVRPWANTRTATARGTSESHAAYALSGSPEVYAADTIDFESGINFVPEDKDPNRLPYAGQVDDSDIYKFTWRDDTIDDLNLGMPRGGYASDRPYQTGQIPEWDAEAYYTNPEANKARRDANRAMYVDEQNLAARHEAMATATAANQAQQRMLAQYMQLADEVQGLDKSIDDIYRGSIITGPPPQKLAVLERAKAARQTEMDELLDRYERQAGIQGMAQRSVTNATSAERYFEGGLDAVTARLGQSIDELFLDEGTLQPLRLPPVPTEVLAQFDASIDIIQQRLTDIPDELRMFLNPPGSARIESVTPIDATRDMWEPGPSGRPITQQPRTLHASMGGFTSENADQFFRGLRTAEDLADFYPVLGYEPEGTPIYGNFADLLGTPQEGLILEEVQRRTLGDAMPRSSAQMLDVHQRTPQTYLTPAGTPTRGTVGLRTLPAPEPMTIANQRYANTWDPRLGYTALLQDPAFNVTMDPRHTVTGFQSPEDLTAAARWLDEQARPIPPADLRYEAGYRQGTWYEGYLPRTIDAYDPLDPTSYGSKWSPPEPQMNPIDDTPEMPPWMQDAPSNLPPLSPARPTYGTNISEEPLWQTLISEPNTGPTMSQVQASIRPTTLPPPGTAPFDWPPVTPATPGPGPTGRVNPPGLSGGAGGLPPSTGNVPPGGFSGTPMPTPGTLNQPLPFQSGVSKWWQNLAPFATSRKTQTTKLRDAWDIVGSSILSATDDPSAAAEIMRAIARDPEAAARGIDLSGVPSMANQLDETGLFHFDPMLLANEDVQRTYPVFDATLEVNLQGMNGPAQVPQALRWTMLDYANYVEDAGRSGDPIDPAAFKHGWNQMFADTGDLYYRTADSYLMQSLKIPADVQRHLQAEGLNLSPGVWVQNALNANVVAAYEGAMSSTPTDELMAASMQRWGGELPTARTQAARLGEVTGSAAYLGIRNRSTVFYPDRWVEYGYEHLPENMQATLRPEYQTTMDYMQGRMATYNAQVSAGGGTPVHPLLAEVAEAPYRYNPLGAASDFGNRTWTGLTHMPGTGGRIGVGEQANYTRSFLNAEEWALKQQSDAMTTQLLADLRTRFGDQPWLDRLEQYLPGAARTGSRQQIADTLETVIPEMATDPAIRNAITQEVLPATERAAYSSADYARATAGNVMLEPSMRTNLDSWLSNVAAFSYFSIYTAKNWLERSIRDPRGLEIWRQTQQAMGLRAEDENLPTRYEDTLPIFGVNVRDPIGGALGLNKIDQYLGEQTEYPAATDAEYVISKLGSIDLRLLPMYESALTQSWQPFFRGSMPAGSLINAAANATMGFSPGDVIYGDEFDTERRKRVAATTTWVPGSGPARYGGNPYATSTDIALQTMQDLESGVNSPNAVEAARRLGWEKVFTEATRWATGFTGRPDVPQGEQEMIATQNLMAGIGYAAEATNPYASGANRNLLIQNDPTSLAYPAIYGDQAELTKQQRAFYQEWRPRTPRADPPAGWDWPDWDTEWGERIEKDGAGTKYLYMLEDPRTNETRYIGQTNNPSTRYQQHLESIDTEEGPKPLWEAELYRQGQYPRMYTFDTIDRAGLSDSAYQQEVDKEEMRWIGWLYYVRGNAVNVSVIPEENWKALIAEAGYTPESMTALMEERERSGQLTPVELKDAPTISTSPFPALAPNLPRPSGKAYAPPGSDVEWTYQAAPTGRSDFANFLPGAGAETQRKLNDMGIWTWQDLRTTNPTDIAQLDGVSLDQAKQWVAQAQETVAIQDGSLSPILPATTSLNSTYATAQQSYDPLSSARTSRPPSYDPLSSAYSGGTGYNLFMPTSGSTRPPNEVTGSTRLADAADPWSTRGGEGWESQLMRRLDRASTAMSRGDNRERPLDEPGSAAMPAQRTGYYYLPGYALSVYEQEDFYMPTPTELGLPEGSQFIVFRDQTRIRGQDGLPDPDYLNNPQFVAGDPRSMQRVLDKYGTPVPVNAQDLLTRPGYYGTGLLNEENQLRTIKTGPDALLQNPYGTGMPMNATQGAAEPWQTDVNTTGARGAYGNYLAMPFSGDRKFAQGYGENPDAYARLGLAGHEGMDWMMPEGTGIKASAPGTVVTVGYDATGYGNYVVIQHDWGQTLYAHLSGVGVAEGDQVGTGTLLGLSGDTGNSSGAHLHFGLRTEWGTDDMKGWVDPSPYLPGTGTPGASGWTLDDLGLSAKEVAYLVDLGIRNPEDILALGPDNASIAAALDTLHQRMANMTDMLSPAEAQNIVTMTRARLMSGNKPAETAPNAPTRTRSDIPEAGAKGDIRLTPGMIDGLNEEIVRRLALKGITTLDQLKAVGPEWLDKEIKGLGPKTAPELYAAASRYKPAATDPKTGPQQLAPGLIKGLGEERIADLAAANIFTVDELAKASLTTLDKIPGIGANLASDLIRGAAQLAGVKPTLDSADQPLHVLPGIGAVSAATIAEKFDIDSVSELATFTDAQALADTVKGLTLDEARAAINEARKTEGLPPLTTGDFTETKPTADLSALGLNAEQLKNAKDIDVDTANALTIINLGVDGIMKTFGVDKRIAERVLARARVVWEEEMRRRETEKKATSAVNPDYTAPPNRAIIPGRKSTAPSSTLPPTTATTQDMEDRMTSAVVERVSRYFREGIAT